MSKFFFAIAVGMFLNLSSNAWAQNCIPDSSLGMASSPAVINACAALSLTIQECEADSRCNWYRVGGDGPISVTGVSAPPPNTLHLIGRCCNPAGNVVSAMVACPIPSNPNRCCNPSGNPVQPITASASQCKR